MLLAVAMGAFYTGVTFGHHHHPHRSSADDAALAAPPEGPGGPDLPKVLPPAAEFEPQSALLLGCSGLPGGHVQVLMDIVAATHRNVTLIGLVADEPQRRAVRELFRRHGYADDVVRLVKVPQDSMWVRDYGPMFLRRSDGSVAVVDARYEVLGGPGRKRPQDDGVASWFARQLSLPVVRLPLRLEWGNLLTNGEGVGFGGLKILREAAKTPKKAMRAVAAPLKEKLGLERLHFLKALQGDPTRHVDMFLTVVAKDTVVVGRCDPSDDPVSADVLDRVANGLAKITTSRGPLKVHRIPMPPKHNGSWRTYTNVVFANGTLLMPTFSGVDPALENEALSLYARLLPGWKVVGINCDSLVSAHGYLHCVCMNVPSFVPSSKLISELTAPTPSEPGLLQLLRWQEGSGAPVSQRPLSGGTAR